MRGLRWLQEYFNVQRASILALVFLMYTALFLNHTHPAHAAIGVSAQAAIVMDADSGRVLYEKNSHAELRIASITKIMTAIIALEEGQLDDTVTVSRKAFGVEGSSIYLRQGEKISLENLLYGLMLRSGNDAAVAIAEHIGGSLDGFVFLMNQKAAELGMINTQFSNPHGLDTHEEHYSSAYDMALLTAYAMSNPAFAKIVGTERKVVEPRRSHAESVWLNKNRLLQMYPHAEGVKTGYTKRAKRTLVSSANKDGHRLIAVTLNAPNDWRDHINMFEYGFSHYKPVQIIEEGKQVTQIEQRWKGEFKFLNSFSYALKEGEKLEQKIRLDAAFQQEELNPNHIPYPAGMLELYLNREKVGQIPIAFIAEEEVTLWQRFKYWISKWMGS